MHISNVFGLLHYILFLLSTAFSWKTAPMSTLRNGFQEQLSISTTYAREGMEKSTYQEGE